MHFILFFVFFGCLFVVESHKRMEDSSASFPVVDECPNMRLRIRLTDGRDFTVLRSRAMETSNLLHRMIAKENARLSQEFEKAQTSQSRQHSGSEILAEEDVCMEQQLENPLEGTKFTEFALCSLQSFWDKRVFIDHKGVLERMMEMLVACSYLEMDDIVESFRSTLIDVLGTAPNPVVARKRFHLEENRFVPPVDDPQEKFYAELFINSWKIPPSSQANSIPKNVEAIGPVTPGDFPYQRPEHYLPDVHALESTIGSPHVNALQSTIAPPSQDEVVCPTNGKSVPPEIIERSNQVIKDGQDKCATCACCGGVLIPLFRHTCRACLCQMCSSCSEYVLLGFEPRKKGYNVITRMNEMVQGKSYVCKKCTAILKEIGLKYYLWSQAMFAASLSPDMACRAGCISPEWYKGAKDYVFRFRRLQNRLPTKGYSPEEKSIIWMNRNSFAGHPLWLIQLLRVADWDSAYARREVHDLILRRDTVTSCNSLLCSKACTHSGLRPIDCIVALNGNLFPLPQIIRCALVSVLNRASDEELLDYIPFLVHYLRFDEFPFDSMPVYEPGADVPTSCLADDTDELTPTVITGVESFDEVNCDKSPLTHMLMNRCLHQREKWTDSWRQLCFEFYWSLSVEVSAGGFENGELRDYTYMGLYNHLRNSLVAQLQLLYPEGTQMLHAISSQYALIDMLKDTTKAKRQIRILGDRCTLFLPFDSSQTVRSIDMDQCQVMKSAKKPVILPCKCVPTSSVIPYRILEEGPESVEPPAEVNGAFLYKLDDLRNDLVVMKCTSIIRKLFESVQELRYLPIVTYRVLPVTKSSGFIELVSGKTVSKVTKMGPISEYLLDYTKNKKQKGDGDKRDVFIQSAAVASVLCYVFGIGDRHLDNLMVTDRGELVNIDFGFLEGKDTMKCPYARIPDDIINYRDNKKIFDDWCVCVFLQLRRYAMHFHSLLLFLHTAEEDSENNIKKFDEFIQSRFCVECDESEAVDKLKEFLKKSRESAVSNGVRDWLHTTGRGMKDSIAGYWYWLWGKTEESKPEDPAAAAAAAADAASAAKIGSESSNKLGKSVIFSNPQRSFRRQGPSRPFVRSSPPVIVQPVIPQSSSARVASRPVKHAGAAAAAPVCDKPVQAAAAAAAAADDDMPVQAATAAASVAARPDDTQDQMPGRTLERATASGMLRPPNKRLPSPVKTAPVLLPSPAQVAPQAPQVAPQVFAQEADLDDSLAIPLVVGTAAPAAPIPGDLNTGAGFEFSNDDTGSGFYA